MVARAVCLISGGIDSCVTAFIAEKDGYDVYALSFDYGQRHGKETEYAREIASAVKARDHVVFKVDLHQFGGSSLLEASSAVPGHDVEEIGRSIPSTYVPARNTVFLSIGLAYAEVVDASTVFIGANAVDYAGYPDCRPEYIEAFQKMADLATRQGVEGRSIEIKTPLLFLTKAEIIKKGLELGAPLSKTWSCYQGGERACGRCDSCLLRLKGFKEAGVKDPIEYEFLPNWYR